MSYLRRVEMQIPAQRRANAREARRRLRVLAWRMRAAGGAVPAIEADPAYAMTCIKRTVEVERKNWLRRLVKVKRVRTVELCANCLNELENDGGLLGLFQRSILHRRSTCPGRASAEETTK